MDKKQDFEKLALEDVAYGTQHAVECLLDILITKGVISEQEFKDKLNEMVEESSEVPEE
ncbi:MAG: hypothetical protein ACMXX7_00215 [Candidatus Woesearchaeota archaeon]